jgi:predicted nucleic acid-binding protein
MGLNRSLIYLDACIIIYFIEEHPLFGDSVRQAIEKAQDRQFCVSPLVELECLVVPLRTGNHCLVALYETFFNNQAMLTMDAQVYRLAAELRAHHRLKTPDALHLATAKSHGCTEIWTNDNRLNSAAGSMAVNLFASIRQDTPL